MVGWLVGRVRAQSRGCTRAALTHGSVVAAAQCGAGANSGHGIGHRNMFHFFRAAYDAQGRRVIIHACTYTTVVMRGKSARCTRAICRAARVLILPSRARACVRWRGAACAHDVRDAPRTSVAARGSLVPPLAPHVATESSRGAAVRRTLCDSEQRDAGANSGHGNGRRNVFHLFGAPCDA